jgi:tetratricopeptide (TPR) repeat protein
VHERRERFAEAEKLLRPLLAELGGKPESTELADHVLLGLANVLDTQGRSDQAIPVYQQLVDRRKTRYGEDDERTLTGLNNLVVAYLNNDQPKAALPLAERIVAVRRGTHQADSDVLASSLNNLAQAKRRLGDYDGAIPLLRDVVATRRRTSPNSSDLAGRFDEAIAWWDQLLAKSRANSEVDAYRIYGEVIRASLAARSARDDSAIAELRRLLPILVSAARAKGKTGDDDDARIARTSLVAALLNADRADEAFEVWSETGKDETGGWLPVLSLSVPATTDEALRHLAPWNHVRTLKLIEVQLDGPGLPIALQLPQLETLDLTRTVLRQPEHLNAIATSRTLREVKLARCRIPAAFFSALPDDSPLQRLDLTGTALTREAALRLAALPALQELTLRETRIGGDVLEALRGSQSLRRLEWTGSEVDQRALASFAAERPSVTLVPPIAAPAAVVP